MILLEHARVHREHEPLALRLQRRGERGKRSIGLAVGAAPEQADVVAARIEGADGEFRAVEALAARRRPGRPASASRR